MSRYLIKNYHPLTVWIAFYDHHASQFSHTQPCDFFSFHCSLCLLKDATLNNAMYTLIEKRHCRSSLDNRSKWRQEFFDKARFKGR